MNNIDLAKNIYIAACNTGSSFNSRFGEGVLYLIGAILTDGTVILEYEVSQFVDKLPQSIQNELEKYVV